MLSWELSGVRRCRMSRWQVLPPSELHTLLMTTTSQKSYAPGSAERAALQTALLEMQQQLPFEVPLIINGKAVRPFWHLHVTRHSHRIKPLVDRSSHLTPPTNPCRTITPNPSAHSPKLLLITSPKQLTELSLLRPNGKPCPGRTVPRYS